MKTILLLCMLLGVEAASEPALYRLTTAQNVWDVAVTDLNGDGQGDILASCCDETSHPLKKCVSVHLSTSDAAGYAKSPAQTLEIEESAGVFFLSEVDGTPPLELVAAHADGATIYHYAPDTGFAATRQLSFNALFASYAKEPLFLKDAALDLNADGKDEWIIPTTGGYCVYSPDGEPIFIKCDVVSETRRYDGGSLYISHRLPAYLPFSLQGDSQKGLAFLSDEFADFAYGKDWQERKQFEIPVNLDKKWDASTKMADINLDGFPDLLVTQTRGTANLQAQTHLYVATAPFSYPDSPTATFSYKGSIAAPLLQDVDGDNDLDVIVINIPFGLRNLINFFMRSKLSVNAEVYRYTDAGVDTRPVFKTTLTMDAPEGRERVAYTFGDFNADGRMDAAFGTAPTTLAIHTGDEKNFVSPRAWMKLEVPSFGYARPYILNENTAQDIVLYHPSGENAQEIEVVIF